MLCKLIILNLSIKVAVDVHGCLFCSSLCVPVMDWGPVQGVSHLSSSDRWTRPHALCDPEQDEVGTENGWLPSEVAFATLLPFYRSGLSPNWNIWYPTDSKRASDLHKESTHDSECVLFGVVCD